MGKVYRGNAGLKIVLDTSADLTDATTAKILVKKPSGNDVSWDAEIVDTKISYTVSSADLDETGLYKLQAYVEFSDGSKLLGETATLVVFDKYE